MKSSVFLSICGGIALSASSFGCGPEAPNADAGITIDSGGNEDASEAACSAGCFIGSSCIADGTANPTNPCETCDVARSRSAYSASADGVSCDDGAYCTTGDVCGAGTCVGVARSCDDGVACTGVETCDETTDSCLPGTTTCVGETLCDTATDACVSTCATTICGTSCVDPDSDPMHCGGCDMPCGMEANAHTDCVAGVCGTLTCDAGYVDCGGDLGTGGDGCETAGTVDDCSRFAWHTSWGDALASDVGLFDVAADATGNVYVSASFGVELTVGSTTHLSGRSGGVIVALDPSGAIRWSVGMRSSNATGDARPMRIAIGPSGEIYVAGVGFYGDCEVNGTSIGALSSQETPFVLRMTSAGVVTWGRTFPDMTGYPSATPFAMAVLPTGGVVISGQLAAETLTMDGFVVTKAPGGGDYRDGWVALIDGDGAVTNAFAFGDHSYLTVYGVAQLPGGDLVVTGQATGPTANITGIAEPITDSGDGFYARFTAAGVPVTARLMHGTGTGDRVDEVRVGPSGDYYMSGRYSAEVTVGSTLVSGASPGVYLARIDASTNDVTWVAGQEGPADGIGGISRFQIDATETIHVAWSTGLSTGCTFGGLPTPGTGGNNLIVAHVSSDGTVSRLESFEASDALHVDALALGAAGHDVVAGWFGDTMTLAPDHETFTSAGGPDQFAAQLDF